MPSFNQLYDTIKGLPSPWNAIVLWVIAFVVAVAMFFKTVKIVHQGEKAMKLRRGRIVEKKGEVGIYDAGIRGLIPFVDTLVRVSVRDRTFDLGTTNIKVGGYDILDIDASITLSVAPKGIYPIHFKSDELERRVIVRCLSLLGPLLFVHREALNTSQPGVRGLIAREFSSVAIPELVEFGFANPTLDITDVRFNAQALIAKAIAENGVSRDL